MKLFLVLVSVLFSLFVNAQDITGNWMGKLKVRGIELRMLLYRGRLTNLPVHG